MALWRARLGVIYPDDGDADADFTEMAPDDVSVHVTRNAGWSPTYDGGTDPLDGLQEHLSGGHLKEAASRLARIRPDVLAYACLSCSFAGGVGYDEKICDLLREVGQCPATTATTALLCALESLRISTVAVVSGYDADRNRMLAETLATRGVRCVAQRTFTIPPAVTEFYDSLGMVPGQSQVRGPEVAYHLGKAVDCSEADAVVVTSTSFRTAPMIDLLERDLDKPVLTANQVLMWHAMQLTGTQPATQAYGRLFRQRASQAGT
jgi:maleate isomerase